MMKRIICLLTLVMLFLAGNVWAHPVDRIMAQRVGAAFLASLGHHAASHLTPVETPFTEFYVFNVEGGGFVLVAGDNCVRPILGYSLNRSFRVSQMPTNLQGWLEDYNGEIARLKQLSQREKQGGGQRPPLVDYVAEEWRLLTSGAALDPCLESSVSPLITTSWNQSPYYNAQCPYDTHADARVVSGCVATATAQIMKYWNHPAAGYGSHSYESTYGTLSANFGVTNYDWSNMPNVLNASSSQTEVDAVAQLMYHIGVAVEMSYGVTGSGAQTYSWDGSPRTSAQFALVQYFKYSPDIAIIARSGSDDETFNATLRGELDQSRPISFSGRSNTGGHNFVLDGYDVYNNFHVNWGWGGYCDGYYTIGALNPAPGGTGGNSTSTYNLQNVAMIGIRPNAAFGTGGTVTVDAVGGNSSCAATGSGSYAFGDTVMLTAVAGEGYRFAGWSNHSHVNPYGFIMNGGNYNVTAQFESIGSDTMSYCGNLGQFTSWGEYEEGFDKYWGIKLPAASLTEGRTLTAMDFYVLTAGSYDVTIYSGVDSPTDVVYNTSVYVSEAELNAWFSVYLQQPYVVEAGKSIWLTMHNNTINFPAAISTSCGNPDGFLYGADFAPDSQWDRFTFMIRGHFVNPGIIADGDTLSYCGNQPFLTSYHFDEWGILIPAADLQGRNYLQAVKVYADRMGSIYTLRVYRGGANAPAILALTQPVRISQMGWNEFALDSAMAIGASDSLWITFSCPDIRWPAAACHYTGNPNSSWMKSHGGNWHHLDSYYNSANSWMIKVVTSATAPVAPPPTVIIHGDVYVALGTTTTYCALHGSGGLANWYWNDTDNNSSAVGDTLSITWNQTGRYQLSAFVTNNHGTGRDSIWVNVVDCGQPVTEYPYYLDFEKGENMACIETLDADGDGYGWHSSIDPAYSLDHSFVSDAWAPVGENDVPLTPDNWFFLPKMATRAGGGYSLQWHSFTEWSDNLYCHYGVYIDTTAGTDPDNYVLLVEFDVQDYYWQEHTVDLSAYAGKTFRLAFRHFDNNGGLSRFSIDYITVEEDIPFFREGDTISYCGYHRVQSALGYNGGTTHWGVCFQPERLVGCDTLKSVMLYVVRVGDYTVNIYQGGNNGPGTLVYSMETSLGSQYGWNEIDLGVSIPVDTTQPLWVMLSADVAHPAAYTYFSGDNNSDWLSGDGIHWVHSSQYDYYLSWLVKVVTASTNPCSNPSRFHGDTTAVACDSYTWPLNGETYTTSRDATFTIHNDQDCDSIVTLHLTVNHGRYTHEQVTHCGPYTWPANGRTYNQSGVKFNRDTTPEGCPIRDTLSLTIKPNSESDVTLEIAASDLPYSFEGQTFEGFGQYDVVIANAVGCDSTIHLTLVHNSGIQNAAFEIQNLMVYPNPTTGLVIIDVKFNSQFSIEVLDLVGRCVAVFENTAVLDLSHLTNGTYMLRVTLPEGVALQRVVKR